MPPVDAVAELLRSRGAERIDHPGGTLCALSPAVTADARRVLG